MAPPAMRQKHSCSSSTRDHPPAEARPLGLVERVVVEEVAVLVAEAGRGSDGQTIPVAVAQTRRSIIPRSTASRWRVPACTAATGSRRATALAIIAWWRTDAVDDPFDLDLVGVGRQQRGEVVGTEQPAEHLAVQLDEQRVAARPGDGRVERRGRGRGSRERHAPVEALGQRRRSRPGRSSEARSAASSMIGSSSARRVSNSWRTNSLRSSRRSPSTWTSGRRSATYERLPRRSMTPSESRPCIASRTEVRAT